MYTNTQRAFEEELRPGEKIIWSGRPQQGIVFRSSDVFVIPFSLVWGGPFIIMAINTLVGRAQVQFNFFLIFFLVVGLYFIIGRFFADARLRQNTYYALTDRRILIVSGLFRRQVQTLNLNTLSDTSLTLRKNGKGTILFGSHSKGSKFYDGTPWPGVENHKIPAFELIDNARRVYEQIQDMQQG